LAGYEDEFTNLLYHSLCLAILGLKGDEMNEIEVKAKLNNEKQVLEKLTEAGIKLSPSLSQQDDIYVALGEDLCGNKKKNVLRVRTQGKEIIFTLKRSRTNELDCIEKETKVSDKKALEDMLDQMSYKKVISVSKKRRKGKFEDLVICLDEVEGLGSFIEVEKTSAEDGEAIQEELFNFLESLGVKREDRVFKGYDTLKYDSINQKGDKNDS